MTTFKEFLTESTTSLDLVSKLARAFNSPRSAAYAFFMGGDADGVREFHDKIVKDGYHDGATSWGENEKWFKKHGVTKLDFDTVLLMSEFDDIDGSDEKKTMKDILQLVKHGDKDLARAYMAYIEDEYDYPEFEAIKKSLDSNVKEAKLDTGPRVPTPAPRVGKLPSPPAGTKRIKDGSFYRLVRLDDHRYRDKPAVDD